MAVDRLEHSPEHQLKCQGSSLVTLADMQEFKQRSTTDSTRSAAGGDRTSVDFGSLNDLYGNDARASTSAGDIVAPPIGKLPPGDVAPPIGKVPPDQPEPSHPHQPASGGSVHTDKRQHKHDHKHEHKKEPDKTGRCHHGDCSCCHSHGGGTGDGGKNHGGGAGDGSKNHGGGAGDGSKNHGGGAGDGGKNHGGGAGDGGKNHGGIGGGGGGGGAGTGTDSGQAIISSDQSTPGEFLNGQRIFQNAKWLTSAPDGPTKSLKSLLGDVNNPYLQTVGSHYNNPVQVADGSNGYTTVHLKNGKSVEIPTPEGGFQPSTGGDGNLSVVDFKTGVDYALWQLHKNNDGTWAASTMREADINGDSTGGQTAVGTASLAGDVSSYELEHGINHALNIVADANWLNSQIGDQIPARHTDGRTAGAPLSEGGKISLPANLDLSRFDLTPAGLHLAQALQRYGGGITNKGGMHNTFAIFTSDVKSAPDLGSDWSKLVPYLQYTQ